MDRSKAADEDENLSDFGLFPTIASLRSRRVPIPLGFKNPPINTLPAEFEALTGDEKIRRTVRLRHVMFSAPSRWMGNPAKPAGC